MQVNKYKCRFTNRHHIGRGDAGSDLSHKCTDALLQIQSQIQIQIYIYKCTGKILVGVLVAHYKCTQVKKYNTQI